jgi:hypothetical protein
MSGLRPGADIAIVETGLRPGEKLHEELWSESEDAAPSSNPKIMLAEVGCLSEHAMSLIPLIRQVVELGDDRTVLEHLARWVGLTNHTGVPARASAPRRNGRAPSTTSAASIGLTGRQLAASGRWG